MRAEEVLAELWRQIRLIRQGEKTPGRIILDPEAYRRIQDYRAGLGELSDPGLDYLGRHSLFGLPVYIEGASVPRVEAEDEEM